MEKGSIVSFFSCMNQCLIIQFIQSIFSQNLSLKICEITSTVKVVDGQGIEMLGIMKKTMLQCCSMY